MTFDWLVEVPERRYLCILDMVGDPALPGIVLGFTSDPRMAARFESDDAAAFTATRDAPNGWPVKRSVAIRRKRVAR